MIRFLGVLFFSSILLSCSSKARTDHVEQKKRPNVLFIAIDDLRPELGCYGSEIAVTPNIDELASEGLQFNRAYCQQAICSPSRASLMTGARPESINIIENFTYFREENPDIITLPQHFKSYGYETVHVGKIFHKPAFADLEQSWSRSPASADQVPYPKPKLAGGYALEENVALFKKNRAEMLNKYGDVSRYGLGKGPAYEKADVSDQTYEDGYAAELAIATLDELVNNDKPFFLGVGFKLPHLDWVAPSKYWDLYDRDAIPMPEQITGPSDGAAMGLHPSFELRARQGIPKNGKIDPDLSRTLKHAYLSSVSYVDALVGKVLNAVKKAGIEDNTIVILWSDHGFHLGDMGIWCKATNYEVATRVPLLIKTPDMPNEVRGVSSEALVELIDMYPTLCELAGLPQPDHLEGQSFVPLIKNPDRKWKKAAFSAYPTPALREWAANPLSPEMRETYFGPLIEEVEQRIIDQQGAKWDRDLFENKLMGYAMRTDRYRLIVWRDRTDPSALPIDVELYDHRVDPDETQNIAKKQPDITAQLMTQFEQGWKGNLADI